MKQNITEINRYAFKKIPNKVSVHIIQRSDFVFFKVRKKAKIRNPYNQIPHWVQDTIWESDKNARKHHIQENQEVSPFPAGDHNTARNRQDRQKKQRFGSVSKKTAMYYISSF